MEKGLVKVKKFNIRNIFCKIKNIIDFKNDVLVDEASSKAVWEQMYFGKDRLRD